MRTTLTIDDDLAGLLSELAREQRISFEDAVIQALRAGLGATATLERNRVPSSVPHSFGFRRGIDVDKLGQLADDLEASGFAATAERSRGCTRRRGSRSPA